MENPNSLEKRYNAAVKKATEMEQLRSKTLIGKLMEKQEKSKFFTSRSTFFNISSLILTFSIIGGSIALLELFQLRYYTEEKQNKELAEQTQKTSVFKNAVKKDLEEEKKRLEEKASKLQRDYDMKPVPLRPDYEKNETLFPVLSNQQDEDDEYMDQDMDEEEAENNN